MIAAGSRREIMSNCTRDSRSGARDRNYTVSVISNIKVSGR